MITPREYIKETVAHHKKQVEELEQCLKDAPDALLDLKVESVYLYAWGLDDDGEGTLHYELDLALGTLKDTKPYRPVSTTLLGMSVHDQTETKPIPMRPGYFRQTFELPDHIQVALNWADEKLTQIPCHEITVQGTRVVKWCGDKDAPPLRDGDVVILEKR